MRFVTCFGCQRGLSLEIAPSSRKILLQPLRPLALRLQGFLQLRRVALRRLLHPGSFFDRFSRQRGLGFDIASRRRKILLQPFFPIVLLPEMLHQLDIAPCNAEFAGQRLRPMVFLFQRLLRRVRIARRRLLNLHRFVVAAPARRQRLKLAITCRPVRIEIAGSHRVLRIR